MPTNLKPEHHFVRHVPSTRVKRHDDGTVYGVFPQAFEMRPAENELSGSWLEFFPGSRQEQLEKSVSAISSIKQVKRRDGIAVASVEKIHAACDRVGAKVRVLHEPAKDNPNPAYATIRGMPRDNLELLSLIADDACVEVRVAGDLMSEKP